MTDEPKSSPRSQKNPSPTLTATSELVRPAQVSCAGLVQPIAAPTEDQSIGFETRSKYRLRLVGYQSMLGAQSQVELQGKRYSIDGEPRQCNGSRRTQHTDYVIARGVSLLTVWRESP